MAEMSLKSKSLKNTQKKYSYALCIEVKAKSIFDFCQYGLEASSELCLLKVQ